MFLCVSALCVQWDVSLEMPLRVEEGLGPYTTLKTNVNMRSLKVLSCVEHTMLQGQGIAALTLAMDHFKEEYKIGVSLKLQT